MLKKDYPTTWGLRANNGVCFSFLDVAQIFVMRFRSYSVLNLVTAYDTLFTVATKLRCPRTTLHLLPYSR